MSCKLWAPEGGSSFLYLPLYRAKMIWYEIDDIYDICVFCVAFPALRLSLRQTGPRPPVPPPHKSRFPFLSLKFYYVMCTVCAFAFIDKKKQQQHNKRNTFNTDFDKAYSTLSSLQTIWSDLVFGWMCCNRSNAERTNERRWSEEEEINFKSLNKQKCLW